MTDAQERKEKDEARRIRVYREMNKVDRVEETMVTLRNWQRSAAVNYTASGNQLAASYYNGKADAFEELMEKLRLSSKVGTEEDSEELTTTQ